MACASPRAYAILADGPHEFMVRATDAAGNTDPSPARQSWTVDTKAPTVGSTAPADGATGVAGTANVEANFSEAMDASSLNGRTFTLTKLGDTMPVAASVSYEGSARKATLDPAQDLESNATYTATIEGGSER